METTCHQVLITEGKGTEWAWSEHLAGAQVKQQSRYFQHASVVSSYTFDEKKTATSFSSCFLFFLPLFILVVLTQLLLIHDFLIFSRCSPPFQSCSCVIRLLVFYLFLLSCASSVKYILWQAMGLLGWQSDHLNACTYPGQWRQIATVSPDYTISSSTCRSSTRVVPVMMIYMNDYPMWMVNVADYEFCAEIRGGSSVN